ncbi:hypothetical protein SAMN05421819_3863 [Bryocella elongata]|uniref:Uncharacterized protein n=1 Tax=Bryocella elongata TaxID=863522 RepID=A0A1H6BMT8_9BACT|nr:hypothetical protein [Bryocella elongata]SEG62029.1 hypothetical protein SAMN05421819_3863 [Bryocella elongata]
MDYAFEFHDSWLKELVCGEDGHGYAVFHASVYRSERRLLDPPYESGWQNVRFQFEGMRIEGRVVELDQNASDGDLWLDGEKDSLVPNASGLFRLPLNFRGSVRMELCLAPEFNIFSIHATAVRSQFEGEFELETIWNVDGTMTGM